MSFFTRAASGGVVGGGVNLSTPGAIPYVSASGTLSQDSPALHWDATNNRLGLGTPSPGAAVDILTSGGPSLKITRSTSATDARIDINNSDGSTNVNLQFGAYGASGDARVLVGSAHPLKLILNNSTVAQTIVPSGSVGIGPSNTSPTGTLHVYDATATTGSTKATVRAGAGQSGSLLEIQNNAGSVLLAISAAGSIVGTLTTPASAAATGAAGTIAWDANYIYVCTAANTWKRVAIATW